MALNNKGGPPDLDVIFRQIKNKFNQLFGGAPSPDGSPGNPVWIISAVLVVIWLGSGFYIVDEREKAIVLRFGAFSQETEPGLRWHLPYPIEHREIVKLTEVRNVDIGTQPAEALMLTKDENIVDLRFSVQYTIIKPQAYLFNNRSDSAGADIVQQVSETAMRAIVGQSLIDSVLNEGRDSIAAQAKKSIQTILDNYDSGIHIDRVNLRNIQPPEQVQAAFEDVVNASQDKERLKSEGQAYANDVIPKASGTAKRLQQESEGYRQSVVLKAKGDANRFNQIVTEYQKAPQVTRDRLYIDAMQQILSSTTKVIVDQQSNQMLYLPLDKIMQQSGVEPQSATTTTNPRVASAPAEAPQDNTRSREREVR